jgi:arginine deiminase
MHLDTIFTFASPDECIAFPPAIIDRTNNITVFSRVDGRIAVSRRESLKKTLEELLDRPMTFIKCGGEDPVSQVREQWTDGANVFALAPGVIVGYERNTETFRSWRDTATRSSTSRNSSIAGRTAHSVPPPVKNCHHVSRAMSCAADGAAPGA